MHLSRGLAFVIALMLSLGAGPVSAQTITDEARDRIQTRIEALEAVIQSGDLTGAMDVVPPRLLRAIATRFGVAEADLKPAMRVALASAMTGVVIEDYGVNLPAATIVTTPDGGRTYLLIPTYTVMRIEGVGRVRTDNQTLALEDEGEWYLIRINDPAQAAMVREAYPEFAAVHFAAGQRSAVE